jgi:hypothetical protein
MSVLKPDNPSAFPLEYADGDFQRGMTLRDYFAAKAMQSVMVGEGYRMYHTPEDLAQLSYLMADAMLKQRGL